MIELHVNSLSDPPEIQQLVRERPSTFPGTRGVQAYKIGKQPLLVIFIDSSLIFYDNK